MVCLLGWLDASVSLHDLHAPEGMISGNMEVFETMLTDRKFSSTCCANTCNCIEGGDDAVRKTQQVREGLENESCLPNHLGVFDLHNLSSLLARRQRVCSTRQAKDFSRSTDCLKDACPATEIVLKGCDFAEGKAISAAS